MKTILAVILVILLSSGPRNAAACGYYGCDYELASMQFGQAWGQLSPYYQRNFGWYDGSNLVAMRNQMYDKAFGINSVPGGFPAILNAFDNQLSGIMPSSNPRNFLPPVFNQMTSMGACIPGFTVGC